MKRSIVAFLTIFFSCVFISGASAWTIEMGDIYEVSGYIAVDIYFTGEDTDNLNTINISVGYDNTSLSLYGITYYAYDDGDLLAPTDTWGASNLSTHKDLSDIGVIYDIMGEEPLSEESMGGLFYPVVAGETTLFRLIFSVADGASYDSSSIYFVNGSEYTEGWAYDAVTVNNTVYGEMEEGGPLSYSAKSLTAASAVPVPAASLLLALGLAGLAGLKRRNS